LKEAKQKNRRRNRLFVKQARHAVLVALFLGISFSLGQIAYDLNNEKKAIEQNLDQILNLTVGPAAQAAYTLDAHIANTAISGLIRQPYIIRAELHSDFNDLLASSERDRTSGSIALIANAILGAEVTRSIELHVPEVSSSVGRLTLYADSYRVASNFFQRSGLILLTGLLRNLLFAAIIA